MHRHVAEILAQDLIGKADVAAVKTELANLSDKVTKDAAALATKTVEENLSKSGAFKVGAPAPADAHAGHPAPAPLASGGGMHPADVEILVKKLVNVAAIDFQSLERKASDRAVEKAIAAIEPKIQRIDLNALKADLYRAVKAELPSLPALTPAEGTPIGENLFKALAREVRNLKTAVGPLLERDPDELFESAEFKRQLEAKIREAIEYVRTEVVPQAIRAAMSATHHDDEPEPEAGAVPS